MDFITFSFGNIFPHKLKALKHESMDTKSTRKKILFLAANPRDTTQKQIGHEAREILEGLKRAQMREQIDLIQKWAVKTEDVRRAILDNEPDIIHFTGFGSETGALIFENSLGNSHLVSPEALSGLLREFQNKVHCVFLNACYSERQANAISRYIDYVIGISGEIDDEASRAFAIGFYDAIGADKSFEEAYRFGCNAMDLKGFTQFAKPVLKPRGSDPSSKLGWVCSNCGKFYSKHTENYFCDDCGYSGMLVENSIIDTVEEEVAGTNREVGLCILLMDASGSMRRKAFPSLSDSPSKAKIISKCAAQGIFSLQYMTNISNAYVCIMLFDDKVKQIEFTTVKGLLKKYDGDDGLFAETLLQEILAMGGPSDINKALETAYEFASQFENKTLKNFQDYTVVNHFMFKDDGSVANIPNLRVMVYTDGRQWSKNGEQELRNPFLQREIDILMGVFCGEKNRQGSQDLMNILSKCPEHDTLQYFQLDSPEKETTLKNLFRMASGTSGFCPQCIN